jgi:replication factor A1
MSFNLKTKSEFLCLIYSWDLTLTIFCHRAQKISVLLDLTILGTPAQKIGDPKPLDHSAVQPAQDLDHMTGVVASGPSAAPVAASSRPKPQPNKPAGGGDKYPVFPIEGLNPYAHKWTIKARVTRKSDIRTWSNQRGEGKLFDVILMDETAEIKATGFNQVVDELYPKFEEGKVYYISKAKVSIAKKKFSNLSNDYELSLERNTEIEEVGCAHRFAISS